MSLHKIRRDILLFFTIGIWHLRGESLTFVIKVRQKLSFFAFSGKKSIAIVNKSYNFAQSFNIVLMIEDRNNLSIPIEANKYNIKVRAHACMLIR